MAETQSSPNDYTSGQPRKHHSLYLEEGTIVMQAENAIFKVHRSLVARYSTAMREMVNFPNKCGSVNGTQENPLVLAGDTAAGWEALLAIQYGPLKIKPKRLTGEQLLSILSIAHKYHMERIEADVIVEIKKTKSYTGFIDLVLASQIINSKELYQDNIQRLISSETSPNVEQAKRMGGEATYDVMKGVFTAEMRKTTNNLNQSHAKAINDITQKMQTLESRLASEISSKQSYINPYSNPYSNSTRKRRK